LEANIDELASLAPWASEFILAGMKKYGPAYPDDSNFVMNYGDAVGSLEYQLTLHNTYPNPSSVVSRHRTFSFDV
jgi:hypothetical protein